MKKLTLFLIFFVIGTSSLYAKHIYPEKYYQNVWCAEQKGETEHVLSDGTRVDCLTKDYAVEFDFAPKWAESIGQSLYYSSKTAKQAGIVLIIEEEKDFKYYFKIKKLCEDYGITLWYMKKPDTPQSSDKYTLSFLKIIEIIINFILKIFSFLFE